jgi:8-oxo-dGTP pyrophosphatase MutT (NUDIX family)
MWCKKSIKPITNIFCWSKGINHNNPQLSSGGPLAMPDRDFHLSASFRISSGTVTLDLAHVKVLLIHWRKTGEYLLPKGRRNIGETLEQAALRETFEETGYNVKLLPLSSIETLATVPASEDEEGEKAGGPITEPVAVQQRMTKEGGTLKIIFWFAASGDSTADQKERQNHQEDEEFDSLWVPAGDVARVLSYEDDRKIAEEALRAVRSEGLLA